MSHATHYGPWYSLCGQYLGTGYASASGGQWYYQGQAAYAPR